MLMTTPPSTPVAARTTAPTVLRKARRLHGLTHWFSLRPRIRRWTRRRYGHDLDPFTLPARRIYILPTRLGVTYGLMLFAMFLGAMNYGNNLALGLTFLLAALGLTAMHHSHRNLCGVTIRTAGCDPVFTGQTARFKVVIENTASIPRYEITVANEHGEAPPQRIEPGNHALFEISCPAHTRGYLALPYVELATRHPFGLFRAWSVLHLDARCIVYPRPAERGRTPPLAETDTGSTHDVARGDDDFAGFRSFQPGDALTRIAWKAYAREQGLQVKLYAGTSTASHLFDWDSLAGMNVEARLSLLCRWVEDAYHAGRPFGLKLPHLIIPVNVGPAHRRRCLTALALFDHDERRAEA